MHGQFLHQEPTNTPIWPFGIEQHSHVSLACSNPCREPPSTPLASGRVSRGPPLRKPGAAAEWNAVTGHHGPEKQVVEVAWITRRVVPIGPRFHDLVRSPSIKSMSGKLS